MTKISTEGALDDFTVQTVKNLDDLRGITHRWNELHQQSGRSPFTHPYFFSVWWTTLGEPAGHKLHVVCGYEEGELVALAPLIVTQYYGCRVLRWAGLDMFDYSDVVAVSPRHAIALWTYIKRLRSYDVALIKNITPESPSRTILPIIGRCVRTNTIHITHNEWKNEDDWASKALSNSTRQSLRRKQRVMEREGPVKFHVVQSGGCDNDRVLRSVVEQKHRWALDKNKTGLFMDLPAATRFVEEIARAAELSGTLHLSWLSCGDAIVATHLGFVHDRKLHFFLPTYDQAWAQHSPGRVLMMRLLGWTIDNHLRAFDFMHGEYDYKAKVANQQFTVLDFMFPGTLIGRLSDWALRRWYFTQKPNTEVA